MCVTCPAATPGTGTELLGVPWVRHMLGVAEPVFSHLGAEEGEWASGSERESPGSREAPGLS